MDYALILSYGSIAWALGSEMGNVLPQLVLLYVVSRLGRASITDVSTLMYLLQKEGINVNYSFVKLSGTATSKDIQLDLNLLKVLGLIREEDEGKYSVTEKGKMVVSKLLRNPSYKYVIKAIERILSNYGLQAVAHGQS